MTFDHEAAAPPTDRGVVEEPRLGACWDGRGSHFAVRSGGAEAVELCLFAAGEAAEGRRVPLLRGPDGVWETYLEGVGPGQLYGYRAHGPYAPDRGLRFNPAKLLVDPYARRLTGAPRWNEALLGYRSEDRRQDLTPHGTDSAPWAPRAIVTAPLPPLQVPRPRIPWSDTVVYECHVKGLTRRHPQVAPELRGTYLGLAQGPVIEHLLALGVTAVELLPVAQSADEPHLARRGLTNYWGYSPLACFAPHAGYATAGGDPVREFRMMVEALHRDGLEVILDAVFNHTAEGDHLGPTLSLRGLDNVAYYRLRSDDPRRYENFTGCGNTLDFRRPAVLRLVLDCLRHWVEAMGVDGFRFDLAVCLGRAADGFDPHAPFFEAVAADPSLSRVKLIAEPWDAGPQGYRLGQFPAGWAEWNDRYRDAARAFWRGELGAGRELVRRLQGSRDLLGERTAQRQTVNYVTAHDGFTLRDLVSYERKHNAANGEENRDGDARNLSRNWGVEGSTDDPAIREVRRRVMRALLATLALSRGVPMLRHGDELGHTQRGNNNAYCQDNEVSWLDWSLDEEAEDILAFAREVFALRRDAGAFRVDRGEVWRFFAPDGREIDRTPPAAEAPEPSRPSPAAREGRRAPGDRAPALVFPEPQSASFAALVRLPRPGGREPTAAGRGLDRASASHHASGPADDRPLALLLLFNPEDRDRLIRLPRLREPGRWRVALATAPPGGAGLRRTTCRAGAHSLTALAFVPPP